MDWRPVDWRSESKTMQTYKDIILGRRRTKSSSMPNPDPNSNTNPDGNCYNCERRDDPYQPHHRLGGMSISRLLCGLLDAAMEFRQRIFIEQLRRCARQSLFKYQIRPSFLLTSTCLRGKTACIKLKRNRIVVSFWSSSSLIVPNKFQSGTTIVLDELQCG